MARTGQRHRSDARSQRVFVLNVKSNKVYPQSVANVHFDKHFGVAEITPEAAKAFCQRNFPNQYDQFCKEMEGHQETLYLDFESVLTHLEATDAYSTLLEVIRKGCIGSLREKADLLCFVALHHLRSYALMNSLVELTARAGLPKFELFWKLKHFLGNRDQLFRYATALAPGRWQFYRAYRDTFPLTDTPVLVQPGSVMVALSPRLLLEIDRKDRSCENGWVSANHISPANLDEFRRRTIGNTFREIIFGDREVLEVWQRTPEFAQRHALMADTTAYNAKVADYLNGEVWHVNAHGNTLA